MLDKRTFIEDKIMSLDKLLRLRKVWQLKGEQVVFTNGCFDLLHVGHIRLLLDSANLGKRLIAALNTDASVRRLKGENRPIQNQDNRAMALAAQNFVDAVVLFDEDTPKTLIERLYPDVLVKGGDYQIENIVGADFVSSHGGSVVVIPLLKGYSTSQLIEKIKNL